MDRLFRNTSRRKRTGSSNMASRKPSLNVGNRSRSTVLSCLKSRKSSQLPPKSTASARMRESCSIRRAWALMISGLCRSPAAAGLLDPADVLVGAVKEVSDCLHCYRTAALGEFQVICLQLPDLCFRDDLLRLDLFNLGLAIFKVVSRSTGSELGEFDVSADIDG